jgi:hypothetical protein
MLPFTMRDAEPQGQVMTTNTLFCLRPGILRPPTAAAARPDHQRYPEGSRANRDKPERSEKRASRCGFLRTAEILGVGA